MALVFDNNDINGDCFILGSEGEPEILLATNTVFFPPGVPTANDATVGAHQAFTHQQISDFVKINTYRLFNSGMAFNDALTCAYIRYLCAREGIISPNFTLAAHHVSINDAVSVSNANWTAFGTGLTHGANGQFADEVQFNAAWGAAANAINRGEIRSVFTDIVCCVAYMFRVRGHHYRAEFAARYASLWARCLHTPADLPTSWQNLATSATHAIMPDVLDAFWQRAVATSRCAGTLIKRFDSAPAGVAGISALKRGLDDIQMIFPGVADRVPDARDEFNDVYQRVTASRWAGSINCRFYGVNRIAVNEASFGALASVVVGIYDKLANDSPLLDSPALKRLASIAPATGGAIGAAAAATTKSEAFLLFAPANP